MGKIGIAPLTQEIVGQKLKEQSDDRVADRYLGSDNVNANAR